MSTGVSSFPGTSGSQEATEGCASFISSRKLNVTLLSFEWGSTKGGVSTFNRELAIQLAKNDNVEVTMYLPQYNEEDKTAAAKFKVRLRKAEERTGYPDPTDWLASVPRGLCIDVVIGHGIHLGRQVPMIKEFRPNCKWIQVVHTDPEELAMFKDYDDPIVKGEKKHQAEVELCKLADLVVAVGPKLTNAFKRYLYSSGKKQGVINLTPGIFTEFAHIDQDPEERETFHVLVFGRGDREDFRVKGYDIAARAVAKLKDRECSFKLKFVGAPNGEEKKVTKRFRKRGISRRQLIVRSAKDRKQLAEEFCQADLVIMPSRTEGFGLAALEALSAGLPVLVSGNSGIAKALEKISRGSQCVVHSTRPRHWAEKIRAVCSRERQSRLEDAIMLRKSFANTHQWEEQCSKLVQKMLVMMEETSTVPDQAVNSGEQGSIPSAIPRTVQQHILDIESQDVHHGASGDLQLSLREYGESHIKLIINTGNLDREKKKFMEETLTQIVHAYVKFNVHSRDNHVEYLKSLNHNIFDAYAVLSVTVHHHSGLP
ncbi:D-inositol 3-phosphate glycosyltransferase-like [Acropora muricata]|uniref:D-inositol 3-phosphate glycosyltransferase-like n=1 Tax=Acropora muricata TaxID=159855 RepID=UPI0034E50559